jgi:hypothetical protein
VRFSAFPALLLASLVVLSACERPFVEVARPRFRVLSPDTSEAVSAERVLLRIEPSSFRGVDTVRAGGQRLSRVGGGAAFEGFVTLQRGVNLVPLEAVDAGGVVGRDTVRLLYLRSGTTAGPSLTEPRADHAAVLLADGSVLVTGGVAGRGQAASDAAFILRPGTNRFDRLSRRLVAARSGHTATLLPDGKVLLVGGTRREGSRSTADLVETVEVFDPVSESFNLLPVEGAPVRRVQHAAFLYVRSGEPRLYLVAGEGDVNYSSPRYAVRPDVRAFAFRGDRLTALQPGATDGYGATLEAVEGHTALPLSLQLGNVADAPLRVFVAGARETSSGLDPVAFELRVSPAGLREVTARAPVIPRTHHAAAPLALDYGLLAGGRRGGGEAATRAEVYSVAARRYFLVPAEAFSDGRLDASATFVGDGRIRLVGGFSPSGIALSTSLLYTATL